MDFFVDTCFFVALEDETDNNHSSAVEIWNKMLESKLIKGYQNFFISDYIIAEIFQNLQNRIGFSKTKNIHEKICSSCNILKVSYPETIDKAIKCNLTPYCNSKTKKPSMGLIDATSLALMDDHKLPYIISFDSHFENVPLVVNISNLENLDFFI